MQFATLALTLSMAFTAACSASVPPIVAPMRERPAPALAAPAGKARVVFVRPNAYFGSDLPVVLYEKSASEALGFLWNPSYFVVDFEPGHVELCGVAIGAYGSTSGGLVDLMAGVQSSYGGVLTTGVLEAGKTYLVRVDVDSRLTKMAAANPVPLLPGSAEWDEAIAALPESRPVELAGSAGATSGVSVEQCAAERAAASVEEQQRAAIRPDNGKRW